MRIICVLVIITTILAFLFTTTVEAQSSSSSTTNTRREWALLDPQGGDDGYHTLIFKENSSSSWESVSVSGSLSFTDTQNLCAVVGYVGSQINAQYRTISPPSGYPAGMTFTGCSGVSSSDRVLFSFEDQCQFSSSGGSSVVQLNCSGYRTGAGAYGVPSGPDTYIKLDYNGVFHFRDAFSKDWKILCDDGTTTTTAGRICTALDGGKTARTGTYYAGTRPSGKTYVGRGASCPSNAVNFSQCTYSTFTSGCFSNEAYSLQCSQFDTPISSGGYDFRMDQSNSRALIDVKPSSFSTYGRICDDGFGSSDATFFCKLLGFPSPAASSGTTYLGSSFSTPIYLKNIGCSSTSTSFASCSRSTSTVGCSRSKSVYLFCPEPIIQSGSTPVTSGSSQLRTLTEAPIGQVQVKTSGSSVWRLMCDSSFSFETAGYLGKYLGRGDQCSWQRSNSVPGQKFAFSSVRCYASSGNFDGCSKTTVSSFGSGTCRSSDAIQLNKCWNNTHGLLVGSYALRLSTDGEYRLEVRDKDSLVWGQITFSPSSTNARSLCSMMGFPTSLTATVSRKYLAFGTIKMTNLYCSSAKSDLASCSFSTSTTTSLDINGTALLGLHCGTTITPTSDGNGNGNGESGLGTGAKIGVGAAVVLGLLLLCGFARYCCWKKVGTATFTEPTSGMKTKVPIYAMK